MINYKKLNNTRGYRFFARVSPNQSTRFFLVVCALFALLTAGCATHAPYDSQGYGTANGHAITKTALSNIGVRYKPGGTTPATGFDCSGLVRWTYGQYGIDMPRTAREQMQAGRAVSKEQLQPGDLVVFKISRRRGYHTGIFTGDGKFVHSPSRGKTVRVDAMDSDYWRPKFVSARRVAQSN